MRTFVVTLFAARINDESKKPIWILRSISGHSWRAESQRLFSEIVNNCVALSGLQFFFVTRDLILGMAGTIVMYELVLLQIQTIDWWEYENVNGMVAIAIKSFWDIHAIVNKSFIRMGE